MDPADATLKINLGRISNGAGYLSLTLNVREVGHGDLHFYISEKRKRTGHIRSLSLNDCNELRKIIKKTDDLLKQLGSEGKLKQIGYDPPWKNPTS